MDILQRVGEFDKTICLFANQVAGKGGGFYFAASLFQKKITQTSDYLRRFRSLGKRNALTFVKWAYFRN